MKCTNLVLLAAIALSGCNSGSSSPDALVEPADDTGNTPVPESPGNSDVSDSGDTSDADGSDSIDTTDSGQQPPQTIEPTLAPTEDNPPEPEPEPIDSTPYTARASDPIWRVCSAETGLGSRDSWQRQQVGSDTYRDCIKPCPTDDSFIPDPDFPGLGWNNAQATACAVIANQENNNLHTVPLYLPNTQPSRQTFQSISAFQIHAGGGQWQCSHQQRNLSSEPFTDTGIQISYRFYSDGQVDVFNATSGGDELRRLWWFDGYTGTRIIGLPTNTNNEDMLPHRYVGNVAVGVNSMLVYRTTVDRLSCTSERASDAITELPVSPTVLEALAPLAVDELTGRALTCRTYESLALSVDGQSFTNIGYVSNLEAELPGIFINISQSAAVDTSGRTRYTFQDESETSYMVDQHGSFDSTYRHPGEVTRSYAYHLIDFRPYNDKLVMTDLYAIGGSGSSSRFHTYSLCDEIQ